MGAHMHILRVYMCILSALLLHQYWIESQVVLTGWTSGHFQSSPALRMSQLTFVYDYFLLTALCFTSYALQLNSFIVSPNH